MYSLIHNHICRIRLLMKRESNLSNAGFTLIELIVAVSIMVLLTGGGIASYITFNDNQQLEGSTRQIQSYLRTAQTKARVGDRPDNCTNLEAYRVFVPENSNNLIMITVCDGGVRTFYKSVLLDNVASVRTDQTPYLALDFKVLHGGTTFSGEVTVTSPSGSTETFQISKGGEISDLGAE